MTKTIDYFYGIGSPFAFIGLAPFRDLAERHGATIRPYLIPLIEDNGGIYSRNRPEPRRTYWTKDLKRWAAHRGKTLTFENRAALSDPTPAGLLVIAAFEANQDWLALTAALQEAFWSRAEDIGKPEVRIALADAVGLDGAALEQHAQSEEIRAIWASNREVAAAAGVFGLPTYRFENELYWGQDSLPFLERHLNGETPIA
ncbi:MAG: 2-hydroxychromene-2-carboxylate isomerase [Pararhizobium sp.]